MIEPIQMEYDGKDYNRVLRALGDLSDMFKLTPRIPYADQGTFSTEVHAACAAEGVAEFLQAVYQMLPISLRERPPYEKCTERLTLGVTALDTPNTGFMVHITNNLINSARMLCGQDGAFVDRIAGSARYVLRDPETDDDEQLQFILDQACGLAQQLGVERQDNPFGDNPRMMASFLNTVGCRATGWYGDLLMFTEQTCEDPAKLQAAYNWLVYAYNDRLAREALEREQELKRKESAEQNGQTKQGE